MKLNEAVDAIILDLTDRRGLRQAWEEIDDDIQYEIKNKWRDIIGAEIKAVRVMQDWQDISTAPRDGTEILVRQDRSGIQKVARWSKREQWNCGPSPMDYLAGATHWMPKPSGPKPEEKE